LGRWVFFFLSALKIISSAGQDHPFLRGLNIQKVADLLAQYKSVRSFFGDKVLTSEEKRFVRPVTRRSRNVIFSCVARTTLKLSFKMLKVALLIFQQKVGN
jgi:hypothetical protein